MSHAPAHTHSLTRPAVRMFQRRMFKQLAHRKTAPECGHPCKRILGVSRTCPTRKMSVYPNTYFVQYRNPNFFARIRLFHLGLDAVCGCGWVCVSRILLLLLLFLVKIKRRFYASWYFISFSAIFSWVVVVVPANVCFSTRKWETLKKRIICRTRSFFPFVFRSSFVLWCAAKHKFFLVIISSGAFGRSGITYARWLAGGDGDEARENGIEATAVVRPHSTFYTR